MKKVFAYQHKIDRYRRKTGHLTLAQHGAYRTLMDEFYLTGGFLPDDRPGLYRIVHTQSLAERRAVDYIVDNFWKNRGDGYLTQNFAENELNRIMEVSQENSENSNARWAKNKGLDETGALRPHCDRNPNQQPTTNNHINNKKKGKNDGKQSWQERGEELAQRYLDEATAAVAARGSGDPGCSPEPRLLDAEDIREKPE